MNRCVDEWPCELHLISAKSKGEHSCLVQVKGQVMDWDENIELWRRQSGGGMSRISLYLMNLVPLKKEFRCNQYYAIEGRRISDEAVLLDCVVTADMKYTPVNSTFHHWTVNSKKFGVTFSGSTDASLFRTEICKVIANLNVPISTAKRTQIQSNIELHHIFQETEQSLISTDDENQSTSSKMTQITRVKATPPPPRRTETTTTKIIKKRARTPPMSPIPQVFNSSSKLLTLHRSLLSQFNEQPPNVYSNSSEPSTESYVSFSKNPEELIFTKHDYNYPSLNAVQDVNRLSDLTPPPIRERQLNLKRPYEPSSKHYHASHRSSQVSTKNIFKDSCRRNTTVSLQDNLKYPSTTRFTPRTQTPPPLSSSSIEARLSREQCIYCQEYFTSSEMMSEVCKDAPDRTIKCIKMLTCYCCADAATYHCAGHADDESVHSCSGQEVKSRRCRKRIVYALVCLFVPCLWCYPVLKKCHKCAVGAKVLGPRHCSSSQRH